MEPPFKAIEGISTASVGDRKILRRVALEEGATREGATDFPETIAAVVDVETTGLSLDEDGIIELALRRIHFDHLGIVTYIEQPYVWLEDPGMPVPLDISRLTGITDYDVEGERIDEDEVLELLYEADIIIAHNASFDKPFLSRRIPPVGEMLWGCSCQDVDWVQNGFEGRSLGWLCAQAGWFFDGHRALADVDAVITLLRYPGLDSPTLLAELYDNARQPRKRFEAVGAQFDVKELLKGRGYRWNDKKRVWFKDVPATQAFSEEAWLDQHVYSANNRPKAFGPRIIQLKNEDRFL